MPLISSSLSLAIPTPDRDRSEPLHAQLYTSIRAGILDGRLGVGTRLPPTRLLAAELGVSRNTVTEAYDRLLSEGYLEARVGDGTYVARTLPEELLRAWRPSGRGLAC
jgi:GntR family transcriptional regulator/MocR family aminotransferase